MSPKNKYGNVSNCYKSVQQTNATGKIQKKTELQATPYTTLRAQAKLMEVFALMLVKQPVIKVDAIQLPNYMNHQQKVREHANDWLNNYNKQFLESSESIANFDRTFDAYYQTLSKAAQDIKNNESKRNFLQGLSIVKKKMNTVHTNFNGAVIDVNKFQNVIKEDIENFKTDSDKIESILATNDKSIKVLTAQIQAINHDINKDIAQIVESSTMIVGGTIQVLIGGVILGENPSLQNGVPIVSGIISTANGIGRVTSASIDLDKQNKLLAKITRNLSDAQALAINLSLAKGQASNFEELIYIAKTAFENVNIEWKIFNDRVNELLESVKDKAYLESVLLKQKLDEIKTISSILSTQAKELTDFVLGSKIVERI